MVTEATRRLANVPRLAFRWPADRVALGGLQVDVRRSGRVAEAPMIQAPDRSDGSLKIEKVDVLATKLP
jgi:hypothetical protein